jgi:hypothetical protein
MKKKDWMFVLTLWHRTERHAHDVRDPDFAAPVLKRSAGAL